MSTIAAPKAGIPPAADSLIDLLVDWPSLLSVSLVGPGALVFRETGPDSPAADGPEAAAEAPSASLADAPLFNLIFPDEPRPDVAGLWSDEMTADPAAPPEIVEGSTFMSGPGFRVDGMFIYYDENGGDLDGSVLFAELRPTAGDYYEIIFF